MKIMLSLKPFNYIKRPINQFLFICFLLITACNDNTELYLDNYLTTLKIDYSQFEAVIIIPNGGCSSCIGSAFNFLKENHSEDNLLFIIANVLDPRAIRLRLKDITNNENVILDASPNFINPSLIECILIYATCLILAKTLGWFRQINLKNGKSYQAPSLVKNEL